MYIQQFYTNCLSEAAYYVESDGEAVIIDPLRDVEQYIQFAKDRGAKITHILETHFHADFVSGHIDLSKKTGAPIIFGPGAVTQYSIQNANDGDMLKVGKLSIKVLHTPGHTLESTCYLLHDETGKPHAIFTGDTLFVGDVGRPDLSSGQMSSEELAGIMYESITQKILPLSDDIIVYPAHGPGSSCGKNLGPNTFSTIGEQKAANYALQPQTKEAFIEAVTEGLKPAPGYFAVNAGINQKGYPSIDEVMTNGNKPLSIEDFELQINNGACVIDTRDAQTFTQGFVPGSVFIGLEGRFAEWAAMLLSFDQPMVLVTAAGKEEESVTRLSRVGFDKMIGFLNGGFEAWQESGRPIDMIIDIEADELIMDIPHDPNMQVVDVRNETEFASGHLENALNLPVQDMSNIVELAQFEEDQQLYIHCAGGYRSVIASSLLKRHGIHNLRNVLGGWSMIKDQKGAKVVKENKVTS